MFKFNKASKKMILWDDVIEESLKKSATMPFRLEIKYFFEPLMEVISNDLLSGNIQGYSANGLEPPIFTDINHRTVINKVGPSGIIFRAKDLVDYVDKYQFQGTHYKEKVFTRAKKAFKQAIKNAQDQSWNMVLSPVIFTCNKEDFEREVGGHFIAVQKMH